MAKYKVLIADSRYPDYEEERGVLEPIGAEVIINRSDDEDEVAKAIVGCDGFIVNLAPAVSPKIIAAMDKCKCVSRYGVGYDTVDTDALKAKGVYLANVPDYCEEDVSDQAFALFMDCVRKIARKDRHVRQGEWNLAGIQKVYRVAGKTFGFVGYGMIARCMHRKLSGFNLGRVLAFDPFYPPEKAKAAGVELVDLDTLCAESDFISVHAPLLPQTRKMISTAQFDQMKATAMIINTSRGPLIDEDALAEALEKNKIACAGLDVFEQEPLPADSKLRNHDNLTISDHAGWYSEESMIELKTKAAQNIADTLIDGKPRYAVEL